MNFLFLVIKIIILFKMPNTNCPFYFRLPADFFIRLNVFILGKYLLILANPAAAEGLAGTIFFIAPVAAVVVAVTPENLFDTPRKRTLKFVFLTHRLLEVCGNSR